MGEVLDMSDEELLKIRNFGDKSLTELREKLAERGITADGGDSDGESPGAVGVISPDDIGELLQAGENPASEGGLAGEPGGFTVEEGPAAADSDDYPPQHAAGADAKDSSEQDED